MATFQFQFGAIKSVQLKQQPKGLCVFQFQFGAIKRMAGLGVFISVFCFNSNMVRLKVYYLQALYFYFHRFNSNMVRLKAFRLYKAGLVPLVSIPIWFD